MTDRKAYYAQGGDKQMESTFNTRLPEIYQVEVTNACNFACDFCPRDLPTVRRPDTFLDLDLARKIAERDLGGSYFVEFQLAGEPTLHKQFDEIVGAYQGKVLTGLSTNGSSVHGCLDGLMSLDYLTISIDSVTDYEKVRPGGKWDRLVRNIDTLVEECAKRAGHKEEVITDCGIFNDRREPDWQSPRNYPHIDLQLIEFPGVEKQHDLLMELAAKRGWEGYTVVRQIPDCFLSVTRAYRESRRKELCLNPWMSCSVQADGDVTSCCFAFGKEVVYGNLNNQSLEEIWATSPELKKFREEHLTGNLRPICSKCYMRSPVLLHWDLYTNTVKERLLNRR